MSAAWRVCTCCEAEKRIDDFRVLSNGRPDSWCKQCHREANAMSMRKARLRAREQADAAMRVEQAAAELLAALEKWRKLSKCAAVTARSSDVGSVENPSGDRE